MAKTKGSLFSLGAHGSVDDVLTYSKRRSGQQARKYNKPTRPPSAKQQSRRRLNEFATIQWTLMSAGDKATWTAAAVAAGSGLSGYHYFMRQALTDPLTATGLLGFWPCNEIVANTIQDFSGNGRPMALKPTPPSDAPKLAAELQTKFGRSLLFDGVNEYADTPYKAGFAPSGALYIEAWIYTSHVDEQVFLQQWYDGIIGAGGFIFSTTDVGKLHIYLNAGGTVEATDTAAIPLSTPVMVGFRFDKPTPRFFVNGLPTGTGGPWNSDIAASVAATWIGNFAGGDWWLDGRIAQVCLYNRAPSDAEILRRYKYATVKV